MVAPDDIEVKVSLVDAEPGTAAMTVKQFAVDESNRLYLCTLMPMRAISIISQSMLVTSKEC